MGLAGAAPLSAADEEGGGADRRGLCPAILPHGRDTEKVKWATRQRTALFDWPRNPSSNSMIRSVWSFDVRRSSLSRHSRFAAMPPAAASLRYRSRGWDFAQHDPGDIRRGDPHRAGQGELRGRVRPVSDRNRPHPSEPRRRLDLLDKSQIGLGRDRRSRRGGGARTGRADCQRRSHHRRRAEGALWRSPGGDAPPAWPAVTGAPPVRTAHLVLAGPGGRVLGRLPPIDLPNPWWSEVASLVDAVRARDGLAITILRLLAAKAGRPAAPSPTSPNSPARPQPLPPGPATPPRTPTPRPSPGRVALPAISPGPRPRWPRTASS